MQKYRKSANSQNETSFGFEVAVAGIQAKSRTTSEPFSGLEAPCIGPATDTTRIRALTSSQLTIHPFIHLTLQPAIELASSVHITDTI